MSAPVFLTDPSDLATVHAGAVVSLTGSEGRHAVAVQRLQPGEAIDLVDGAGRRACGTVAAVRTPDALDVEVRAVIDEPVPTPRFVVAQAIAKGEHAELAVDLMTQLGVDEIIPWQAARSIARWSDEKAERARAKWESAAAQAAKQCRRARVPRIASVVDLGSLIARVQGAGSAIVLSESATRSLVDLPTPITGELLLIVGPEGGIGDEERTALVTAGAVEAVLGPTVLRASLAGAAALAVLSARLRWGAPMEGSRP